MINIFKATLLLHLFLVIFEDDDMVISLEEINPLIGIVAQKAEQMT